MATTVNKPAGVRANLPGRRYDRQFFMAMVILLMAVVAIGFAPTYYLAGVFRAPLPGPIVHIHGAVFTCWMLLLLAQTGLISAKQVRLHPQARRGRVHTGLPDGGDGAAHCFRCDGKGKIGPEFRNHPRVLDRDICRGPRLRRTGRVGLRSAKKSCGPQTSHLDRHGGNHRSGVLSLACFISLPRSICRPLRDGYVPRSSCSLRSLVDAQGSSRYVVGKWVPGFHGANHHPRRRPFGCVAWVRSLGAITEHLKSTDSSQALQSKPSRHSV